MRETSQGSKILATVICLAMILSTTIIMSDKASAEIVIGNELSMPEMPPIPPFMFYGIVYDENNVPVSDAIVTITNLRTGESLDADVYENGAYESILEDLPSGYAVGDNIEISLVSGLATTSKTIIVEQMGFGKRVDFNLDDNEKNVNSENTLASSSKVQNNAIETTMIRDEASSSLNTWPERITENSEPIIIDSIETTSLLKESSPDDPIPSHKPWRKHPPIPKPIDTTDIVLKDIRAPPGYRYALDDQRTPLKITLENVGDRRYIVLADLTNVKPDGSEEFIKRVRFGAIRPDHEKTRLTFWQPDTVGENYVRVDVKVRQRGSLIPMESYEASFAVVPSENVIYWQDKVIDEPQEFYDTTIIVFGDLDINAKTSFYNSTLVIDPIRQNTTINAETIWSGLLGTWYMDTQVDGATWINVTKDGTFTIKQGAHVTTTDTTTPNRYQFTVYGALNIQEASTVEYVWGNTTDLSLPGGIQIYDTNNVNITGNSIIQNGATHGIYLSNSSAVIKDSFIKENGGDGIVVVDSSVPQIEGNTIEWNGRYGINADNSTPIIRNNDPIQYNGMYGIYVKNVTNETAIIEGNIIKENFASGIYASSTNITIANNTISSNGLAPVFEDDFEIDIGWNMVGYPTDNRSVNVSTAFASIDAYRDKPVYGYYEDEPYFVGSYGEDYIMKPGEAYWVYVNATTVWTVNW